MDVGFLLRVEDPHLIFNLLLLLEVGLADLFVDVFAVGDIHLAELMVDCLSMLKFDFVHLLCQLLLVLLS